MTIWTPEETDAATSDLDEAAEMKALQVCLLVMIVFLAVLVMVVVRGQTPEPKVTHERGYVYAK